MCQIYKKNEEMKDCLIIAKGIVFILMVGLFCKISMDNFPNSKPTVSVGDIWMYTPKEKDPFKKVEYNCYKVLELKQGFVKYINLRYGWTSSSTISDFTYNAKKIR